ncbi:hypothetical protein niasHT_030727 [Heterodera trifolii]|uniref:Transmembrane protein n=1 Tax=Heterodera trifolii TaxID=157864 RepID=A0ABD2HQ33_9BILA
MTTSLGALETEWETYKTEFEKAEAEHLAYLRSYREMCTVQEGRAKNVKHLKYLLKQLGQDIDSLLKKGELSDDDKGGLEAKKTRAAQMNAKLAEMEREVPLGDNGMYLNIILGSNLNITLPSPDERYRYKKEYESFKLSVAFVILAVFFVVIWLPPILRPLDALCNFLLVWYYCTLTIRESILRLNGSRIKGWGG